MRLVGPNGEQVGIVAIGDALRLAQEADLDLVEVAPMARPPVCKLMDYGKFKYETAMKAREARKNQAHTVIKEMKLRPKIDPHDYATKRGHVVRFLKAGDKVKITIMFRGREQSRPELGYRLLQRLAADVEELGFVESAPKQDGRNMIMVLGPHKKKAEARAEKAADRAERTERHDRSERPAEQPVAAEPVASEPVAAEQVAAEPVVADPVGADPVVAEPVATAPAAAAPAKPVPAKPAAAKPTPAKPTPAKPAPAKAAAAKPAPAKAAAAKPAPAKPVPAKPVPAAKVAEAPADAQSGVA